MRKTPSIISIGYGRHLFVAGNAEQARLAACAEEVGHLHLIVFTHAHEPYQKTVVTPQFTLHPTASKGKVRMVYDAYRIAARLIANETVPPIVTTQDPFETGILGLVLKYRYKVKLVVQIHADFFGSNHYRRETILNRIRYVIGRGMLPLADRVRVVSRRIADTVRRLGAEQITILPVAIDTAPFLVPVEKDTKLFPPGTFTILSVARFVPVKNFPLLLRAFKQAYMVNPKLRLLLVGTGPEEEEIRTLAAYLFNDLEEKPYTLLPWRDDVPALMRQADAYALSSNYEGWGRVLIEAMVAELPVVTTDVGCAGEVCLDGIHGIVTPVGDEAAFATALIKLSTDATLYRQVKATVHERTEAIPGTDLATYSKAWADSLVF